MTATPKRLARCALSAMVLMSGLPDGYAAPKHKAVRHKIPVHARAPAPALNRNLGDYDPWGRPAEPGCRWSRLQVPTAQGLRWVAVEECDPDFGLP